METTLSTKNDCGKTRPKENPYETWDMGFCLYHVLKKQKSPAGEAKDKFARWTVYAEGEFCEVGDMYAAEVKRTGRRIY